MLNSRNEYVKKLILLIKICIKSININIYVHIIIMIYAKGKGKLLIYFPYLFRSYSSLNAASCQKYKLVFLLNAGNDLVYWQISQNSKNLI